MFFYVDEGGNTGLNLFDASQPILYYGVISSAVDLDTASEAALQKMRAKLGVPRIHAKELGNDRLSLVAAEFVELQKKLGFTFDFYKVVKADHAVMAFFDQVFDSGMNEAVRWANYWTPLRFGLLLNLGMLFDLELAEKAWKSRIEGNDEVAQALLVEVCQTLIVRLPDLPDKGARSRLHDALKWAIKHPDALSYNASTKGLRKREKKAPAQQISPNIIGFQFVMQGIATRLLETKREASRIVVDQQGEFNTAQKTLADFYKELSGIEFPNAPEMPKIDFEGMPSTPIEFLAGDDSAGLELVDVMLWIHRRVIEEKPVSPELMKIVEANSNLGVTDEISLNGIWNRWKGFLTQPVDLSDLSPEQLAAATAIREAETARVRAALDD
ncbi:DUF3800 domain-containing protein [Rugamonas sp. A1-17]|nr:DUF3800 domain-containing protein [Rugamonas sp. A1-17]